MKGQPKPAFFFVVLLVILGLVGYAFYRYQNSATGANNPPYSTGKKGALAQNSSSHFFSLSAPINAGTSPNDVAMIDTNSALEAAAVSNADKNIANFVSRPPVIYNLAEGKGKKMLVSTQTAHKLTADVRFARADFERDYPATIETLVRGIFDDMMKLEDATQKPACCNYG